MHRRPRGDPPPLTECGADPACRLEFRGWHRAPLMQPGRFTELSPRRGHGVRRRPPPVPHVPARRLRALRRRLVGLASGRARERRRDRPGAARGTVGPAARRQRHHDVVLGSLPDRPPSAASTDRTVRSGSAAPWPPPSLTPAATPRRDRRCHVAVRRKIREHAPLPVVPSRASDRAEALRAAAHPSARLNSRRCPLTLATLTLAQRGEVALRRSVPRYPGQVVGVPAGKNTSLTFVSLPPP